MTNDEKLNPFDKSFARFSAKSSAESIDSEESYGYQRNLRNLKRKG